VLCPRPSGIAFDAKICENHIMKMENGFDDQIDDMTACFQAVR
jgi:hypothetical protein